MFELARLQRPSLYFVLVSDRPERGRSCLQAVPIHGLATRAPFRSVDLDQLDELKIYRADLENHEVLARRIFALLATA